MSKPAKCSFCYWDGQCHEVGGCDDFTPLDPYYFDDDEFIEEVIENERQDFYSYWSSYNREREDELFI